MKRRGDGGGRRRGIGEGGEERKGGEGEKERDGDEGKWRWKWRREERLKIKRALYAQSCQKHLPVI